MRAEDPLAEPPSLRAGEPWSQRVAPYLHLNLAGHKVRVAGTDSRLLGHQLRRRGKPPDGVFASWSRDDTRVVVQNDRYGLYPLYYFATDREIAVSPSILRLLDEGAPRALDEDALAAFLRLGYFVGEDTPFRSIRALPPAATLEWAPGRLQVSGELRVAKRESIRRRDAIDGYLALFRTSIQRRAEVSGPIILPLSGGRDSRHILLDLCAVRCPPTLCVTAAAYPTLQSDDVPIAALVARRAGIPHLTLEQSGSRVRSELRKNIATNLCADEHTWHLVVAEFLHGRADTVYDGIGGDVLSAGLFLGADGLALLESGRLSEFVQRRLFWANETGLARLLDRRQYETLSIERATARVVAELRKHLAAPNPIGSFYFWNRTRREIALAPYLMLSGVPRVFAPFVDHDVFDFLSSLPATMFLDQRFHSEAIEHAHPQFCDIPFSAAAVPVASPRGYFRRLGVELAWYTLVHSRSRMVRRGFLLPRFLRCAVDGRYESARWWSPLLALYVMQLERVSREGEAPGIETDEL